MNNQNKSREELISELEELQEKYSLLLASDRNFKSEDKSSEFDFQNSKKIMGKLAERMQDLAWSVDPVDFGLLSFNTVFSTHFAEDHALRIGDRPKDIFNSTTVVEYWQDIYQKALANEQFTAEYLLTSSLQTLELTFNVIRENNVVLGILVFGKDITARKIAELELEESREKYLGLSEAAFESIFISEKGICIEQNHSAEKTFGYTSAEAIGRYGTEWIIPEDREMVMNKMISGYEEPYEATALKKDGTTFPCSLRGKMMHYKGKTVRVTSLMDITRRKQIELELINAKEKAEENEANFRSIFENSLDAIGITKNGINVLFNPAYLNLYGYELPDELIGKSLLNQIAPKEHERIKDYVHKRSLGEYAPNFHETIGIRKNGEEFPLEVKIGEYSLNDERYTITIIRDISERKKAESILKRNYLFTEVLLKSIPTPVFFKDRQGKYIGCNESFAEQMGTTTSEIKGKTAKELWPEELAETYHQMDLMLIENPVHQIYEYQIIDKGGRKRDVIFAKDAFYDESGTVAGIIGAYVDITDRKLAEEKLGESEERYRTLFQQASDGIFYMTTDGDILAVNEAFARMHGYTVEEMSGLHLQDLDSPEGKNQMMKRLERIMIGEILEFEAEHYHKDGHLFTVAVSTGMITVGGKNIIQAFHRDITSRKQEEEELLIAKQKAEESDKLKSSFLANMSHEIRTPLNAITSCSMLMTSPNQSTEELEEVSQIIIESTEKLISIITDVIEISHIYANQIRAKMSEFDVIHCLNNLSHRYIKIAQNKKLDFFINMSIPDKEFIIVSDSDKLRRVVSHLIENALKFTHKGSVTFDSRLINDNLQISISDTGIGIPKDMQKIIFEPFRQVDFGDNRKYDGNGLGLSISKAYVESLGGSINLKSKINRGTEVVVSIPVRN